MTGMESRNLRFGALVLFAAALVRFGLERTAPGSGLVPSGPDQRPVLEAETRSALEEELLRRKPLAPGERIDPNRAGEEDLDRLPGVGPSTARAILEERDRGGGFSGLEDLLRVRGVGRRTLDRIAGLLDFSEGIPLELRRAGPGAPRGSRSAISSGPAPSPGRTLGLGSVGRDRIDVNRASAEELTVLPGIGPALASRIVESRASHGPFRTPEDLLRVRGIGPGILEKIRTRIRQEK
jgi:competence protein ComEA